MAVIGLIAADKLFERQSLGGPGMKRFFLCACLYLATVCLPVDRASANIADEVLHIGTAIRQTETADGITYIGFPDFLTTANGTTRAWNFGGAAATDQTILGVAFDGPAGGYDDLTVTGATATGKDILDWAGDPQRLAKNNIANTALQVTGAATSWSVKISATPGATYNVEVLSNMESGGVWRNFDIDVDGVKYADNFFVPAGVTSGGGPPDSYSAIYRFPVTADADGIDIVFSRGETASIAGSGGSVELQTRPYVTAMAVSAVPEPSAFALVAFVMLAAGALLCATRRRAVAS